MGRGGSRRARAGLPLPASRGGGLPPPVGALRRRAAGVQLGATSLVDVSDGLVADLGHVCSASGVDAALESGALVVDEPVAAVGAALGVDPLSFVLTGGDDHALVATFPAGSELPEGWVVVGRVVEASEERGRVLVDGAVPEGDGRLPPLLSRARDAAEEQRPTPAGAGIGRWCR